MWVEVKILEEQRTKISSTKKYELSFKGLSHVYKTSSKLLYPELDPKVATLTLRLRVKNASHNLFPGMYASVISIEDLKTQLTLPVTAVIRKNAKYYVFLVGDFKGEYEPVEVKVKMIDANTYSLVSGLNEGDEVVNNALFMMDSDAQINGLY